MPDIFLLSKIYYQKSNFQEVANSLGVSLEALKIQLLDLFVHLFGEERDIMHLLGVYLFYCKSPLILGCYFCMRLLY